MEGYEFVIILLVIVSVFLFIIGYINKREGDDGSASVYYAFGLVLLILAFVAFILFMNLFNLVPIRQQ
jgi:hypothetical protein